MVLLFDRQLYSVRGKDNGQRILVLAQEVTSESVMCWLLVWKGSEAEDNIARNQFDGVCVCAVFEIL